MAASEPISISVVIPAYNAEKYLARAIKSVLEQTYKPNEIIVVDDGSTDGTYMAAAEFRDSIRYIYQDNSGESGARNRGIKEACGNWIAFLDADDEWLPERLERQVKILERQPELVWVGGNYIRRLLNTKQQSNNVNIKKAKRLLKTNLYFPDFFRNILSINLGCTDVMLINKYVLEKVGLFQYKKKIGADVDLWWRIAYQYPRIGYVVNPIAIYYLDIPTSISQSSWSFDDFSDLLDRHLKLSAEAGKQKDFLPLARNMMERWMRAAWFTGNITGVRDMLTYYKPYLHWWFAVIMRLMLYFPSASYLLCRGLSRLNRRFHFRKTVLRPIPPKKDLETL